MFLPFYFAFLFGTATASSKRDLFCKPMRLAKVNNILD
jgi:hypothetical protein